LPLGTRNGFLRTSEQACQAQLVNPARTWEEPGKKIEYAAGGDIEL
jgi:hypothetical protein